MSGTELIETRESHTENMTQKVHPMQYEISRSKGWLGNSYGKIKWTQIELEI